MKESRNQRAQKGSPVEIYPLLLGIYPLLALLANNIGQVRLTAGLRAGLISLALSAGLYWVFSRIFKSNQRGAVLTALALVLFFSYGHVYGWLEGMGSFLGRHRYLAPLWGLLLAGGTYAIARWRRVPVALTQILNVTAAALLVFPLITLLQFRVSEADMKQEALQTIAPDDGAAVPDISQKPDVYYIILDSYSREDVLSEYYDIDNSAFLDELRAMGFVIPHCAQSNYAWTPLSLSSSLHMDYLLNLDGLTQKGDEHLDYLLYLDYVMHNPVRSKLEGLGYHTVTFNSSYTFTTVDDAEYFLTPDHSTFGNDRALQVSEFEVLFVRTTALRVLSEGASAFLSPLMAHVRTPEQDIYERIIFMLDALENMESIPAPRFVFAHLPAPHAPFVVNSQGEFELMTDEDGGYAQEIQFINRRMLEIVRHIIETSEVPPIIVIQADHGYTLDARTPILNAYYLPGEGAKAVYDSITPVNTFRLIFNEYFQGDYPYLEDKSYFSTWERQLELIPVPSSCVPAGN